MTVKGKHLPRRIIQYAAGLICMAVGIVLLKHTGWGVSPITAVPDAVANITPLSLGNATILLHILCVIIQVILQRRITLKSVLTVFVGILFGWLVDFFMWLWTPAPVLWEKIVMLVLGVAIQGLGVALVSGCDMMLPAPDELNNLISRIYEKKLSNVKLCADAVYVIVAAAINLIFQHSLASVGINSVVSVLLTGQFVGLAYRFFPKIKMSPFFPEPTKRSAKADRSQ
ncbi:MAG: DUF6198 family protein [Oscillospiraceae bacterium]|nr:DUF6198 family protein [Oscillospiraceae bacterium]